MSENETQTSADSEDVNKGPDGAWLYQLRLYLHDGPAALARTTPDDPALGPLPTLLAKHSAHLSCQFDAFANYVAMAEQEGEEKYPLAAWTRATIENPAKKAKYIKSFTIYIGGEVYSKDKADALEADLEPLVGGPVIAQMTKHDTNPANNPQMPEEYRPK